MPVDKSQLDKDVVITGTEDIVQLIKQAASQNFWGVLAFHFQNGRLVLIKKESTYRVGNEGAALR